VGPLDEVNMPNAIDKFRGINVEVSDLSGDPKEFLVRFTARPLSDGRRPGDAPTRASHQAIVVVRVAPDPEVVGYIPPEVDFANLGQEDFERRALEDVRPYVRAVRSGT
jgi:hypothetical protein